MKFFYKKMRSKYFLSFKKDMEAKDACDKMIKAGFINRESSGIYSWLAPGLRMVEKICNLCDYFMNKVDGVKISLPILQDAELWKKSGRYDEYGEEMLKIQDRNNRDYVYGPTAEEIITHLYSTMSTNKYSFPMMAYNIQWKFRDEIRPRYGVVRSREFLMKDAYSFHKSKECMMQYYEKMFDVYSSIFYMLGLNVCTFDSDVDVMGGLLSHEFIVRSAFGETSVALSKFPNQPIKFEERNNAALIETTDHTTRYAEIGQIYALGDKYTKVFKFNNPETGDPLFMGCYGIGITRLTTILFEHNYHDFGIVAPFDVVIITIPFDCAEVMELAMKISDFSECDVLLDDRNVSYGEKCAEADLLGPSLQVHIGKNELQNGVVVLKRNRMKESMPIEQFFSFLKEFLKQRAELS